MDVLAQSWAFLSRNPRVPGSISVGIAVIQIDGMPDAHSIMYYSLVFTSSHWCWTLHGVDTTCCVRLFAHLSQMLRYIYSIYVFSIHWGFICVYQIAWAMGTHFGCLILVTIDRLYLTTRSSRENSVRFSLLKQGQASNCLTNSVYPNTGKWPISNN